MKKGLAFTIAVLLCLLTAVLPAMKPVQAATANDYQVEVYGSGNQGLPLNISPDSDSAFYVTLMEGTPLHIDQVSDGFGHVFYNGLSGWVQLHYTRIVGDYPVLQPSSGWVSPADYQVCNTDGEGLELRGGPSSDYSTFGSMSDGDIFTVEAVSGNWAYGRYNGVSGWAYMSYLQYVGPAAAAPASSASLQSKVVTIGSDLTDEQEAFILQYFGADLSSCRVIYVTNQQEREYLGSWIPLSEITADAVRRHSGKDRQSDLRDRQHDRFRALHGRCEKLQRRGSSAISRVRDRRFDRRHDRLSECSGYDTGGREERTCDPGIYGDPAA